MTELSHPKLVFVVGVWRSGTSLLHAFLNRHPQMALMFEAEPFGIFPLAGEAIWPANWAARLEFFNQSISRHRLDVAALPKNLPARDNLLTMFRTVAARKNAAVMGGKSPTYHKWLPEIAAIFPEAEFVVIWRDPLDCCRSAARAGKKNRFFSQPGILTRTFFGVKTLALGVEALRRAGKRVHELTYPDLVANPAAELGQICGFLGVPFDAQMLDLASADFSMVPAGEHHERVRSGAVVKLSPAPEIVAEAFVAKGGRYAVAWRERFAHLKLAQVLPVSPGASAPDEAERLGDWLTIRFWKEVQAVKHGVFANIPLAWWARLRERDQGQSILNEMSRTSSDTTQFISPAGRPPRHLTFSIVTPSFRNSDWLKLCIASVADQTGVELEHIVQDSCSDDGTGNWLPHDRRVKAFIEKDAGMYDAVNRGYRRATGDILAYLNCDEQYLPGALAAVRDYFETHPEAEVLLAGSIITDGTGQYICHRQLLAPNARHIWFRFPFLTSSVFLRRSVIAKRGLFFDTRWRDLGDFHWAISLLQNRVPIGVSDVFTSTFADTGENMNMKPNAIREKAETEKMIPAWLRPFKLLWILNHRLRRYRAGHFNLDRTSYEIYTKQSPDRRVEFYVPKPTAVWWNRM